MIATPPAPVFLFLVWLRYYLPRYRSQTKLRRRKMDVRGNIESYQLIAVDRLRDALVSLDAQEEVQTDDSSVCLEDGTELTGEAAEPLTLGHLRDIVSIFYSGE